MSTPRWKGIYEFDRLRSITDGNVVLSCVRARYDTTPTQFELEAEIAMKVTLDALNEFDAPAQASEGAR